MASRIALVGMCDKGFVDEILCEIEKRHASGSIAWNPRVDDGVRDKLTRQIERDGYFRFFMYEKKGSGGEGIRLIAHVNHWEDIYEEDCYNHEPCLTRFLVKGYEVLDGPLDVSKFKDFESGDSMKARSLGKAFGYVRDPEEIRGKDMTVFVMLAWNSNGWQSPSGSMTVFKMGDYYPDYGFGHEEWNFRIEHAVNGFVYGFMMGRPIRMYRNEQEPFPVYFYSPFEGDMYLIGAYLESQPVSQEDIDDVHATHTTKGIIDQRGKELLPIVEDRESFGETKGFRNMSPAEKLKLVVEELGSEGYTAKRYLKCPVRSLARPARPIPIDRYLTSMMTEKDGYGRYGIPLYLRAYPVVLNKMQSPNEPDGSATTDQLIQAIEGMDQETEDGGTTERHDTSYVKYTVMSQTREYRRKEFDLVDEFRDWLRKTHQIQSLKESKSIDVRFAHNGVSYGVEAKYSDGEMRFPIRDALGQILEYNFYPGRTPKDHWIVVLNKQPRNKERLWFSKLKLGVPVSLCWHQDDDFRFEKSPF